MAHPGEPPPGLRDFLVSHLDYHRLAMWFMWLPSDEATKSDREIASLFWGPPVSPYIRLAPFEARLVRKWYDFITECVLDPPDEQMAEKLDMYLDDV